MDYKPALVLLSGGMDSAVALFWALPRFSPIHAMFCFYGQVARAAEHKAARSVWDEARKQQASFARFETFTCPDLFLSQSSILHRAGIPVDQYKDVKEAVDKTSTDRSYIPMRNAVLVTIASHRLLDNHPNGGAIIIGTRGRSGPGGFPDCTPEFAATMSYSLTLASGQQVLVVDPLNIGGLTRTTTIMLAQELPGCFDALAHTVSCFKGEVPGCGHCLPCLRRAQAFAEAHVADPALAGG